MITSLDELSNAAVWLAWRNEKRGERLTKVPYSPNEVGRLAETDNPETWSTKNKAEQRAEKIVNGLGGGIGPVLGVDCGDDLRLAGTDLDSCVNPDTGVLHDWALEILVRIGSYAEKSPSRTGVKIFFLYRKADFKALLNLVGGEEKTGRQFKQPSQNGKEHAPGFEVYFTKRFFASTFDDPVGELRVVDVADIEWLIQFWGGIFGQGEAQPRLEPAGLK